MTLSPPRLSTVLCAVDFSEHARSALYLAAGLTFQRGSRLVVLTVDPRAGGTAAEQGQASRELADFVRRALPGVHGRREGLDLRVRAGATVDAVLAAAAEFGAELIVVGTRGRGAVGRALFGSTAAALMERSPVPLAVVPPSHPEIVSLGEQRAVPHFGIIFVPVDLATPPVAQTAFAARFSPGSAHHLFMVHVTPTHDAAVEAQRQLQALTRNTPAAPERGWRILALPGTVPDTILEIVHRERIGLVVLGRSSTEPGKLAYELVRGSKAVIVTVPEMPGMTS
ncbi:MAG: universal stress protein [Vicinamibacterales bacterium]